MDPETVHNGVPPSCRPYSASWRKSLVDALMALPGSELLLQIDRDWDAHLDWPSSQRMTNQLANALIERLSADRVIPVFLPPELVATFEPAHKWSKCLWYIPVALIANRLLAPVLIEMQGVSAAMGSSRDFRFIVNLDWCDGIPGAESVAPDLTGLLAGTGLQDPDPNWLDLTFEQQSPDGTHGQLTLAEWIGEEGHGHHLRVAEAILDVWCAFAEDYRDSPFIDVMSPNCPERITFNTWSEVERWAFQGERPAKPSAVEAVASSAPLGHAVGHPDNTPAGRKIDGEEHDGEAPLADGSEQASSVEVPWTIALTIEVDDGPSVEERCEKLEEYLSEFPEEVDALDSQNHSALHWAAWDGNPDLVSTLLRFGADPNLQEVDGFAPLHLAFLSDESAAITAALIDAGADLELRAVANYSSLPKDGATPLFAALSNYLWEAAALLEKAGASLAPLLEPTKEGSLIFDVLRRAARSDPELGELLDAEALDGFERRASALSESLVGYPSEPDPRQTAVSLEGQDPSRESGLDGGAVRSLVAAAKAANPTIDSPTLYTICAAAFPGVAAIPRAEFDSQFLTNESSLSADPKEEVSRPRAINEEKVKAWVEMKLEKEPQISTAELFETSKKVDTGVKQLSLSQFATLFTPQRKKASELAWFELLLKNGGSRVEKGAVEREGSKEFLHREAWEGLAVWVDEITYSVTNMLPRKVPWHAKPHSWQNSGYLSSYYWGRIYPPSAEILKDAFHVGIQIADRPRWIDSFDPDLEHLASRPCLALWVATNDNQLDKIAAEYPTAIKAARRAFLEAQATALASILELSGEDGSAEDPAVRLFRKTASRGGSTKWVSHLLPAEKFVPLHGLQNAFRQQDDLESPTPPGLWSPIVSLDWVKSEWQNYAEDFVSSWIHLLAPPVQAAVDAFQAELATDQVLVEDEDDDLSDVEG